MLEVVTPGLLSTIQDAGRPGYTALGVPESGACDPWARAAANLLLGNPADAPVLEITIAGPELRVLRTCVIALAGTDLEAHVAETGYALRAGGAYLLRAGATLAFAGARWGARAYLALAGGIAVPPVLGSASTYLPGGFGGLDGRALRPGDVLEAIHPDDLTAAGRRWPLQIPRPLYEPQPSVRVLPGPDLAHFQPDALDTLLEATWTVGPQSDRMGLRLQGPSLVHTAPAAAELVSRGITWGAMQVPAAQQPIVLLADHQTVGGYPVLAVAIRADWPLLAQLAPGAGVRFALTTMATAQAAYAAQQEGLRRAAAQLAAPDLWDRALQSVGHWIGL